MRYYEFAETTIKPKKPLTPDQARIQGMKNQVKTTQKAIKAGQQALAQSGSNL